MIAAVFSQLRTKEQIPLALQLYQVDGTIYHTSSSPH